MYSSIRQEKDIYSTRRIRNEVYDGKGIVVCVWTVWETGKTLEAEQSKMVAAVWTSNQMIYRFGIRFFFYLLVFSFFLTVKKRGERVKKGNSVSPLDTNEIVA